MAKHGPASLIPWLVRHFRPLRRSPRLRPGAPLGRPAPYAGPGSGQAHGRNLLKDHAVGDDPAPQSYRTAAELVAYCIVGADAFAGANDAQLVEQVERRIEAAAEASDGLDAQLVLLTLHAKIIQPSVVHTFGLKSSRDTR
jgi:hypothetical protein